MMLKTNLNGVYRMHAIKTHSWFEIALNYELVANVLRDNMDIIIFDLRGCGGC